MISTSTVDRLQDLARWLAGFIALMTMLVAPTPAIAVSPSTTHPASELLGITAPTTVMPDHFVTGVLSAPTEEIERARVIVVGLGTHPSPEVVRYLDALYSLLRDRSVETIDSAVELAADLAEARMALEQALRGTDLARELDELLRSGPARPVEDRRPTRDPVLTELMHAHPALSQVMSAARSELRRRFGADARLTSEGKVDPESGDLYAVLRVGTALPLEEALRRRDAFDEEWWLDRSEGLLSVLVIDVEPV